MINLKTVTRKHIYLRVFYMFSDRTSQVGDQLIYVPEIQAHLSSV